MKILHPLLCYYPSQAGGPANTIHWINQSLNSKEFKYFVVSTDFEISKKDKKRVKSQVIFTSSAGISFLKHCLRFFKSIDVIQFSGLFFPPTLPLLFLAMLKNKTVVISARGELYDAAIAQKRFKKYIWILIIRIFQRKIHFHATNDFELGIIQRIFPNAKSTAVIPNYINMPKIQKHDIKKSFVFVGRINPIKNIHLIIAALSKVHEKYPEIQLDIVGSARFPYELEYHKSLVDLTQKLNLNSRVNFLGHLNGDAKNKIIASNIALLLPSKSENFGNVVLEALAQGTPVIASKNTPWKILEDYNVGYWIEADENKLASVMKSIINKKNKKYKKIRENAYNLCKSKFEIKSNIYVWEKYYRQII